VSGPLLAYSESKEFRYRSFRTKEAKTARFDLTDGKFRFDKTELSVVGNVCGK
jgi:hypothetical protein